MQIHCKELALISNTFRFLVDFFKVLLDESKYTTILSGVDRMMGKMVVGNAVQNTTGFDESELAQNI